MSEDRCVCCGAIIPEGRMVCPTCERQPKRIKVDVENPQAVLESILQDIQDGKLTTCRQAEWMRCPPPWEGCIRCSVCHMTVED